MSKKIAAVVIAIAGIAFLLSGCNSDGSNSEQDSAAAIEPQYGGKVIVGVPGEATGWLPQVDRWGPGPFNVARALFDPLAVYNEQGEVTPWLAESFIPEDDNKTWLIKIRPDIEFSNGETVSAHSVVYNLRSYQESALTGFAYQPVRSIEKVDDFTVKVTLDQEWANFPTLFTGQAGFIAAPEQLTAKDSEKPIGSGPFVIADWEPGVSLTARKNPSYWRTDDQDRQLPFLDSVEFRPEPDEKNRTADLNEGDLDIMFSNSPDAVRQAAQGDFGQNLKVITDESQGDEAVVVFNTQSGTMADESLRKALQLATDRDAIVAAFHDVFEVADGPFTKESPWWSDSGWPDADIEEAKALVAAWSADHDGAAPSIEMATLTTPDGVRLAQELKDAWTPVGFETNILAQDEEKFSGTVVNGDFDAIVFNFWNGDDPDANYHFWTGENIGPEGGISLNMSRWINDEAQSGLDGGRAETDPDARREQYAKVWSQWAEHVPYLWLYHGTWIAVVQDFVHGIDQVSLPDNSGIAQPISWGSVNLSNAWIEGET